MIEKRQDKARPGLSVIVPVYNEKDAVITTVANLRDMATEADFDVELILVDDGSNDGTEKLLPADNSPSVRVLRHAANMGYGRALKTGLKAASYPYVAITDADSTYPHSRIPELYEQAVRDDLDMIVGARTGKEVRIPWIRKPPKWVLNRLANYLTGRKIPDLNSGLRVMRARTVNRFLNILPDGFSFTTTITLAMLTNDCSVDYVPVDYMIREGRSKIRPLQDTMNFLQLILRTVLYFQPLKIFLPVSIVCVLASLGWAAFSWIALGRVADVSTLLLFLTGVQVGAIGLLADLIDRRLTRL